jgi:hypothetical protein
MQNRYAHNKNIPLRFLAIVAVFFAVIPIAVHAGPVIRTGDTVTLTDNQTVGGDLYLFGGVVSSLAAISDDVYVVGGGVTIDGSVGSDLSLLGGTADVQGPVGDDIRIIGGRVTIGDNVAGDVAIFGGEVTILPRANITGDILFYGGSLDVEGSVHGSILAKGERIRINGPVDGSINATAFTSLTFGANARVLGSVTYLSPHEMVRALDSEIVGAISHPESALFSATSKDKSSLLVIFLVLLFTSLVVRFLFGHRIDELLEHTVRAYGLHGVLGLGVLIAIPLIITLLFVSVIGFVLGLATLFIFLALVMTGTALAPIFVGALLSRIIHKKTSYTLWWAVLGAVMLFILAHIPYVGFIALPVVVCMVIGGLATRVYGYFS